LTIINRDKDVKLNIPALLRGTLYVFLLMLPPFFIFLLLTNFVVDVPYWDQWDLIQFLPNLFTNNVTIDDLLHQHNEHRILFPRVAYFALIKLGGWSINKEIFVSFAFASLSLFTLWRIIRLTVKSKFAPWLIVVYSFLVFSLVQQENWLWGWQLQWFITNQAILAAYLVIIAWQGKWLGVGLGSFFTVVVTFLS
jgi:hypothetical protein